MVKDREARPAAVHGVAKSQTWLSNWTTTAWQNLWLRVCFLWTSSVNGFLRCNLLLWRFVEMSTQDLEYSINLVDKESLRGRTPILKEVLLWAKKCYQTSLHATEKSFVKGRINHCGKLRCHLIYFKKLPKKNFLKSKEIATAVLSLQQPQHRGKTLLQWKDYDLPKVQMTVGASLVAQR